MANERESRQPPGGLTGGSFDSGFSLLRSRLETSMTGEANEEDIARLKAQIHERLLLAEQASVLAAMTREQIQPILNREADAVLAEGGRSLPLRSRTRILQEILDEVTGYGPIQPLLLDESITEIMVNGPKQIYVERAGRLQKTDRQFRDNQHVMRIIERIVAPLGRRIDESSPMVDARLPDGSRVNVIIPPLSIRGPVVTIRKFFREALSIDELVRFGSLTTEMAMFTQAAVKARLNVIVSGGTGSGKTTTLNVLSSFIPVDERIVTIEDAAELQLQQDHIIPLESRPANLEGKGEISIRALVRNALRMRPDRIVIGECRGGEALDMLQAMNTGHDGSITTCHSNSPRDTVARLETMTLMAGTDLPARAILEQIASAIDVIVHQSRFRDGTRKITHISEVQGMEGNVIVLQDVFKYDQQGLGDDGKVIGRHIPTGLRPRAMDTFKAHGIDLPPDIFKPPPPTH
jgi:pilus assembly protein CpaF